MSCPPALPLHRIPFLDRLTGGGLPSGGLTGLVGPSGGGKTLLAMPRPSNMKNLSITLQTGKGLGKEEPAPAVSKAGKAPKVERSWMTRDEVAAAIKKSRDSVDNYCRDGKLESAKVGREVRISRESVQRYLEGRS